MSETSVQVAPTAAAPPAAAAAAVPRSRAIPLWYRGVQALASLRLTVGLLVLSIVLVFFGTLAQIDHGVWTVVNDYFRSFFVWIRLQLLVQFGQVFFGLPKTMRVPGAFPFPGGWLLGIALLVNLLAAHAIRFQLSWKRSGILLIHAGLIVMLLGELATGLLAIEGNMTIPEGRSTNYVDHTRFFELAVVRPDDKVKDQDVVTVVPESRLRRNRLISHPDLPFDIQPLKYMSNSALRKADGPDDAAPATHGEGLHKVAVERREGSGVDTEQRIDVAACYAQLLDRDGNDLGTYLFSPWLEERQSVSVGGKTYDVALRFRRTYKPYSIHLIDFRFDKYMGTQTAKNYSSLVQVIDPERNEDRQVLISMNDPLRYRGDALYQHSFHTNETTTVLQVVKNPAWLMPYISCGVVSLGMFIHFGIGLNTFLRRRPTP